MPAAQRTRAQSRRRVRRRLREPLGPACRPVRWTGGTADHEDARPAELHAHARNSRGESKRASTEEKLRHNAWEMTGLADPNKPIVLIDLLAQRGWMDLDYFKIDVDGADFDILQSLDGRFDALGVLAVELEVNFVGTEDPSDHTFHNTDRFLRAQGFDLFGLDVRNFSTRALPARSIWPTPAETVSGRPFQGEAYYARDVLAPHRAAAGDRLSADKLAKLAAVFAAWDVPDAAAELL